MKMVTTLALAGAVMMGGAPQAWAFKLSPPKTSFSGSGPATFAVATGFAYECQLSIRGATNKLGVGRISTAIFNPGAAQCGNTAAVGLPWTVKAINATTAKIINLQIATPFGLCGPATIPVTISGGGVWTINTPVAPTCAKFTANIPTAPPIIIVP